MKPLVDNRWDRERLVQDWAKREKEAIEQVDELFASAGLTMDEVMAQTLVNQPQRHRAHRANDCEC